MAFDTGTSSTTTERMRITSDGKVGIGVTPTSSYRFLTLYEGNNATGVAINGTNAGLFIGTSATGGFGNNAALARAQVVGYHISGSQVGDFCIGAESGAGIRFGTSTSGAPANRMYISSNGDVYVPGVYANTTGNGANVFVGSDGQLERSTSSQRYKNTINDATHGLTELLTLRPVTYKSNNDGDTVFGGLIAEEVHDAGLTEFVQYNNDDEPDALAYGNMVSLCIKAIQELKTELDEAKARIVALETA